MKRLLLGLTLLGLLGLVACNKNEPSSNGKESQTQFIDVNLPSGTLWATEVETLDNYPDGLYTIADAKELFGNRIPTKAQWEELLSRSTWKETDDGIELTVYNYQADVNAAPARNRVGDLPEELVKILIPLAGKIDCEAEDLEEQLMAYLWTSSVDPATMMTWYLMLSNESFEFGSLAEACAELSVLLVNDNTAEVAGKPISRTALCGTWKYIEPMPKYMQSYLGYMLYFDQAGTMQRGWLDKVEDNGTFTYDETTGNCAITWPLADGYITYQYLIAEENNGTITLTEIGNSTPMVLHMEKVSNQNVIGSENREYPGLRGVYGTWSFSGDVPADMASNVKAGMLLYMFYPGYAMAGLQNTPATASEGSYSYDWETHILTVDVPASKGYGCAFTAEVYYAPNKTQTLACEYNDKGTKKTFYMYNLSDTDNLIAPEQ